LYERITTDSALRYAAGFGTAAAIDSLGIVPATNGAAADAIRSLGVVASEAFVQLDAGLRAPPEWEQKAFVRGDATYPAIAFASIIAKVSRDRLMVELEQESARYGFAIHKGYGTLAHRQGILSHGLSEHHRRSFCKSLTSA
jgi:ribonuclease HII